MHPISSRCKLSRQLQEQNLRIFQDKEEAAEGYRMTHNHPLTRSLEKEAQPHQQQELIFS